jgi:outer membrane cobalamin receptor
MKRTLIAVCAAISGVIWAHAQESTSETTVISVTKNALRDSQTGSAYSRIQADEIHRSQQDNLLQVLDITPGIQAVDAGPPGGFGEVMIRGNGPSQSLILVDGVKIKTGIRPGCRVPFLKQCGGQEPEKHRNRSWPTEFHLLVRKVSAA